MTRLRFPAEPVTDLDASDDCLGAPMLCNCSRCAAIRDEAWDHVRPTNSAGERNGDEKEKG